MGIIALVAVGIVIGKMYFDDQAERARCEKDDARLEEKDDMPLF
jgi:hypothetical protein